MNQPLTNDSVIPALMPEMAIQIFSQGDIFRETVESFIYHSFQRAYGAEISHFMPQLMAMQRHDRVEAALGVNVAQQNVPLFLECYLQQPVEQLLAEHLHRPISRSGIVEVGNLAAHPPGAARFLFIALNAYLLGAGIDWAVFTAVPRVINSFSKLGIPLQPLAEAHVDALPEPRDNWGSYYQQQPKVVVGDVAQGARRIQKLLMQLGSRGLNDIWEAAYLSGERFRYGRQSGNAIIL